MDAMTPQKLKKILQIEDWSEIKTEEQFYLLMERFYCCTPALRNKIISAIEDLPGKTENFLRYCIDGIVDYEPSIMINMIDRGSDIKKAFAGDTKINTPKKKKALSELYCAFSEWFSEDGEVQCVKGEDEMICSVSDAVEMAIENESREKKEPLNMLLLTKVRKNILEQQEIRMLTELMLDDDVIYDILGDEAEALGLEPPGKRYLN